MDLRLMCGVLELSSISCSVVFLRFGPVSFFFYIIWQLCNCHLYQLDKLGRLCFPLTETEQGVALAILRGVLDFKRDPWPQISESAKSLVRQMLDPDPTKRLTSQQVLGEVLVSLLLLLLLL